MQTRRFLVWKKASPWRIAGRLMSIAVMCAALHGQTPPTTTISDTVFRADGTPAAGTLLISWPAFTTASGAAIAGGTKTVTLGTGGSLTVALVPNAGATPGSSVYTVVYQLADTVAAIEQWKKQVGLPF